MPDRDLAEIGAQRDHHGGQRVAMDQHAIGLPLVQRRAVGGQDARRQRVERLAVLHQVEVDVGRNAADLQHLVEQFAMLRRHRNAHIHAAVVLQRVDDREHLDRLGPRAEADQHARNAVLLFGHAHADHMPRVS